MYRERGYCTYCLTTIYREEWRKPKLPEISVLWHEDPSDFVPLPIEIEYFYKYFDEHGDEVTRCPGCSQFIRSSQMDKEDVRGWCLSRDSLGTPTLSECAVVRGAEGLYFAETLDRDGNWITIRTYQRGEAFFTDKQLALRALVKILEELWYRHQVAANRINKQIEETKRVMEREAEDAGR